jgi:hypothetical protein
MYPELRIRALHPSKIEVGWVGVRCDPTRLFKQSGVGWTPDTRPYFGRVSGTGRVDAYCPVNYLLYALFQAGKPLN